MVQKVNNSIADKNRFLNTWHREKTPNVITSAIK